MENKEGWEDLEDKIKYYGNINSQISERYPSEDVE